MITEYDVFVDATEDDCPMPTILSKNTLDNMRSGQILKLITSKEGSIRNIRTLVANNPYELISESKSMEGFILHILKL
jgi:tRNA 2-thiouridine synthesizing protein A